MKEVKMFDALDIIIGMLAGIAAALIPALAVVAHVARQKAQQKAAHGATELLPLRQTCIFASCWVVSVGAVVMMAMIGENQFQEALSPSTTFLGI